jgi:pimeloyl-ACP methyl ester carboxylesterase
MLARGLAVSEVTITEVMASAGAPLNAEDLEVGRVGSGPAVVLVHGSVVGAGRTWRHQLALAEQWSLCLPNRPGFGASPPLPRGDFEREAPLVAELLADGAHLVGHSYGAVIALYAAALRPSAVRSLTVSEPGCLRVAAGDPMVDTQIAHGELLYERATMLSPLEFLHAFRGGVGSTHETPDQLTGELLDGVRLLMRERPPWEADPPLQALDAAAFPKLVISGGHSPVFEAVCDAVAEQISASRAVVSGRGHTIPATGAPYNARLQSFLAACEAE